jgi:hypothetical protein
VKTRAGPDEIVGDMQQGQRTAVPEHESLLRQATGERSVLRQFVDAVVAFSDDHSPANLERYLAASRSLEESRRSGPAKAA